MLPFFVVGLPLVSPWWPRLSCPHGRSATSARGARRPSWEWLVSAIPWRSFSFRLCGDGARTRRGPAGAAWVPSRRAHLLVVSCLRRPFSRRGNSPFRARRRRRPSGSSRMRANVGRSSPSGCSRGGGGRPAFGVGRCRSHRLLIATGGYLLFGVPTVVERTVSRVAIGCPSLRVSRRGAAGQVVEPLRHPFSQHSAQRLRRRTIVKVPRA